MEQRGYQNLSWTRETPKIDPHTDHSLINKEG